MRGQYAVGSLFIELTSARSATRRQLRERLFGGAPGLSWTTPVTVPEGFDRESAALGQEAVKRRLVVLLRYELEVRKVAVVV